MKKYLEVGDIVIVSTILTGLSEYPVKKIEGNKAITAFRVFHRKIYVHGHVYEYGKRYGSTSNGYWIKEPESGE